MSDPYTGSADVELDKLKKRNCYFKYIQGNRKPCIKKVMRMMSHQIQTKNKETEIIKENQIQILEMKSTVTKILFF